MGISSFLAERDWSQNSCYGNSIKGVISFLLRCTVVVPSFQNTASIFPEISFIQYFCDYTTNWNFDKKILDFDKIHVVKHANAEPIKININTLRISFEERNKTPHNLKACTK